VTELSSADSTKVKVIVALWWVADDLKGFHEFCGVFEERLCATLDSPQDVIRVIQSIAQPHGAADPRVGVSETLQYQSCMCVRERERERERVRERDALNEKMYRKFESFP
jgi:hypothetical protein